ncbi:hypothetical protein F0P96_06745 [Hymenobacter busanensis]|uniref:Uncharacterized protein n=1 Tax=Hymenobacter busanensis TaxID=2607656 RepID=A0A7L5A185_9BACT|nr:hypothetical protein [Hymenobacter busanensis]KAA9338525.1 hypothetical protein F0P96_06745 [Hymenobacter busanensis]QHJ09047.1 hypothetical protein GUY19_17855 [Hymenobacter busanensis]
MAEEQQMRGADYGMAAFLVAALVGGCLLDFGISWRAGLVSLLITGLGIWLLIRVLRRPLPIVQKALFAMGIAAVTMALRIGMFMVLRTFF